MKVTSAIVLSTLGFSLNAAAQLSVIEGVITTIEGKVSSLDTTVKAYNGGSDVSALQSASDGIVSATNSGVSTVKGSADLSETDALGLTSPVQTLTTDIQTSVNDLISKKPQLEAACQGAKVLADLQQQKTAAAALSAAITSKVPTALQSIASQLSAGITEAIQKGIDAFQGSPTSCGSSTSSAPASSSTSSASASGTSSAPASTLSTASSSGVAPSSTGVAPSSSGTPTPSSSGSGSPTGSSTSTPTSPLFTGAASMNGFSAPAGLVAALAAILAF